MRDGRDAIDGAAGSERAGDHRYRRRGSRRPSRPFADANQISASTANFPPSNTTGAASRSAPTARCFKPTTGSTTWQKHVGARQRVKPAIVVGRFTDGEIAFLLPLCHRTQIRGCAGCAGSARTCATTTRRCWRAIFRERVDARSLPRHLADLAGANAARSAAASRLDRL